MEEPKHRGRSTVAERAEVWRLHGEGVSIRAIAFQVFGSVSCRSRVERILRAPGPMEPLVDGAQDGVDLEGLTVVQVVRLLLERTVRGWAARAREPSMGELRGALAVQRELATIDFIERQRPAADEEG